MIDMVKRELIEKLPLLKMEAKVDMEDRSLLIRLPRQRKFRRCVVMETEDGYIIQGDNIIFEVYREPIPWAVYNPNGKYFLHLSPEMGGRPARVPKELLDLCEKVVYKKGDTIGYLQTERGVSRVVFGGTSDMR